MTFLSKRRGGVRVTFDGSFVLESCLQASITFPGYAGAKDLAPKVYWQSNLQAATLITYLQPVTLILAAGTEWIDLWTEFDARLDFAGQQLAVFNTPVVIALTALLTDPQLYEFGTRNYSLTFRQALSAPANYFASSMTPMPTGVSPVTPPVNQRVIYATGYFKAALVKARLLKVRDVQGAMPIGYNALYYLGVKYPAPAGTAGGTAAPWPIITSQPAEIKVYASTTTSLANLTLCEGTLTNGFVLPMGTRFFRIYSSLPTDTYAAWLQGQKDAGYTAATRLFEDLTLTTEDYGIGSPYFHGKNLAFIPTPYHILTDSP